MQACIRYKRCMHLRSLDTVIVNIDAKYKSMRTLEDDLYLDFQVKTSDCYRRENSV
jgi:hypothetical protein